MRFMISLAEQAMGSLTTFGINLWLVRNGEAASYGVYVFWFSLAWMMGSVQGTLTLTHLFNLPSAEDRMAERRDPERLLLSVSLLLMLLAGLAVIAADAALSAFGSQLAEPAAAAFIPAFLLYQYVRAFAFSRGRTILAAVLTGAVLAFCILALGLDRLAGFMPDATRVLAIVAGAYAAASFAVLRVLLDGMTPMVRPSELRKFMRYLRGSGWMMLGSAAGEAISRLYSFAVVARFGAEALARLSAVQVVIRPAWMLSAAWTSVGFPTMATRRAANDRRGLIAAMLQGASVTLVGSALWSAAVITQWPLIAGSVYRGRYEDAVGLAYLWAGNVMLGSVAVALNVGLLTLGEFRRLALLDLAGAAVCMVFMLLLGWFDYPFAVVATMAGQVTQIVLMVAVLQWRLRAPHPIAA